MKQDRVYIGTPVNADEYLDDVFLCPHCDNEYTLDIGYKVGESKHGEDVIVCAWGLDDIEENEDPDRYLKGIGVVK